MWLWFWVGNFHQKKNLFGKNLYILVLFYFFENVKNSGVVPALLRVLIVFSLGLKLKMVSILYQSFYNTPKFNLFLKSVFQKWDFECLVFKVKTRTVKSHLPNAETLITPRSAQLAASCSREDQAGVTGWKVLFSLLALLHERQCRRAAGDLWRGVHGSPKERDQRRRQKGGSCLVVWRLLIQGCSPCRS